MQSWGLTKNFKFSVKAKSAHPLANVAAAADDTAIASDILRYIALSSHFRDSREQGIDVFTHHFLIPSHM